MFIKSYFENVTQTGCCACFGFASSSNHLSEELLLDEDLADEGNCSYNADIADTGHGDDGDMRRPTKCAEDILLYRIQHGLICREFPVKDTHKLVRSEDGNGNKMINQYVRVCKIGSGSYGKVVLYRSSDDGKHYAIKAFHKSHLSRQRVGPHETAMNDVLREVLIMKMLEHPNIVNLIEVINDPTTDHFYMVLEYVEGKRVCEGSGPPCGLGESEARKYMRDILSGLIYLHDHNIVHGDIKPDNLLVTAAGTVKIGDFSVSQVFEDDDDELRRSPGTPVFTAPECCLGLTYHGKAADTWAVGVTLYCMVFGKYPFLGDSLQDTYGKIVKNSLSLPGRMNCLLKELIEGLLRKDPRQRMTLQAVAEHPWVIGEGPIPQYLCWCKRSRLQRDGSDESR